MTAAFFHYKNHERPSSGNCLYAFIGVTALRRFLCVFTPIHVRLQRLLIELSHYIVRNETANAINLTLLLFRECKSNKQR